MYIAIFLNLNKCIYLNKSCIFSPTQECFAKYFSLLSSFNTTVIFREINPHVFLINIYFTIYQNVVSYRQLTSEKAFPALILRLKRWNMSARNKIEHWILYLNHKLKYYRVLTHSQLGKTCSCTPCSFIAFSLIFLLPHDYTIKNLNVGYSSGLLVALGLRWSNVAFDCSNHWRHQELQDESSFIPKRQVRFDGM